MNQFNESKSLLEKNDQSIILDFIFPNNKKDKDKKRDILKNNYLKISLTYGMYVMRQGLSGMPVNFNHFYNMVNNNIFSLVILKVLFQLINHTLITKHNYVLI